VDKLTDMGGGVYKWEMEKVGTAQVNIQTVYASKYTSSKTKGTVGLMKMVVAPVVEGEFEKLVDKYIANLIKRFGGEVL
jgi:hypothetical protein